MNFKIKNVLPLLYQSPCGHYIFLYLVLSCLYIRFCIFILLSGLDYSVFSHKSFIWLRLFVFKCLSFIISGYPYMYIC